jgi:hypothetical protein
MPHERGVRPPYRAVQFKGTRHQGLKSLATLACPPGKGGSLISLNDKPERGFLEAWNASFGR